MKTLMTLAQLLAVFQPVDDAQLIYPPSQEVLQLVTQTSELPRDYVRIADEAFAALIIDERREPEFMRLIEILRILLYVDGRAEHGLLRVVELTHTDERTSFLAINSLAALANHYRSCKSTVAEEQLAKQLTLYAANPLLTTNALSCLRHLRRNGSIQ